MRTFQKVLWILVVLFLCVGCDQASKHAARVHLSLPSPLVFFGDMLRLQCTENVGAFLGFGSRLPEAVRFWLLIVTVAAGLAGMTLFIWMSPHVTRLSFLGGSFIVAGGFSNWLDRLCNKGAVIDFINIGIGRLRTGIFNVADLAIMVGVAVFLLGEGMHSLSPEKRSSKSLDE